MEPLLDDATVSSFLPPTRRIIMHIAVIAAISLIGGPLLGLYVFNAPRGEMLTLSLRTGLGWGLSFAFVAAFIYTAWLIRTAWKGYYKHVAARKMDEFYRAIEGEQTKD
ncbi:hypothetical protein SCD_n02205 [Sulfuricella denitrificans skB26]|uniref:Transmembrane protein n=2 Tax=Sulfuricella denitrificans TaxID=649841 RepID=S6AMH8_SULDS|nr:hypothetical protein SCD_n02205 [Sulfuricella denitrificans skB26]